MYQPPNKISMHYKLLNNKHTMVSVISIMETSWNQPSKFFNISYARREPAKTIKHTTETRPQAELRDSRG